ncbi:hypothetical protein F5I97DRAFT_189906 [Phlebopus sp. FC_14]|nr:hypothetical protein F5I97DRAFT_189906 [Phlebopus sp. FC_14]
MAASPTLSTTVLGKRKSSSLVLRLSSSPAPTDTTPRAESSTANLQAGPSLPVGKKARYPCAYAGCNKSYSKPSRLSEHYRSHTGERPFVCKGCGKSYLRETHLQAHSRSHLPDSERPYVCTEASDCKRRFWTLQHLQVHENTHRGEKSYACTEIGCDEVFAKHHQLRSHVCATHSPPGTKPYICSHPGCTKSFSTNQKLRGHVRIHDDKRYTCSHLDCLPGPDKDLLYFETWTALQAHIRTAHPPMCTHSDCKGRTFASHHGLRSHLKLHEQQELADALTSSHNTIGSEPEVSRPQKRRRGGEFGREWKCDFPDCGKDFKSQKALNIHNNVIHLGQRNHICPHQHCKSAFGYKHLLQRHLVKLHSAKSAGSETNVTSSEDEAMTSDMEEANDAKTFRDTSAANMNIDAITGKSYSLRSQMSTAICCPYPHVKELLVTGTVEGLPSEPPSKRCDHVLTRAYDLRRHLKAEHGIDTEKEKVVTWVKGQKGAPAQ